jgi:hypothetical protein
MNRARKARYASALACGHWVNVGNLIVCRDGATWICLDCLDCALAPARDRPGPAHDMARAGET